MLPCSPTDLIREVTPEEFGRHLMNPKQRFPLRVGRRVPFGVRFRNLYPEALGELPHRILKPEIFLELHEFEDVATDPAAEAVEEALVPVDVERWILLGVERAEALVAVASLFEREVVLYYLHDVGLRLEVVEERLRKETHVRV
jgi:hypothetical protein